MKEISITSKINTDELIWEYHKLHQKVYDEQELSSLMGLNKEYTLKGENILQWHSKAIRNCALKFRSMAAFSRNFDDIMFWSEELLFITASLYLYLPYINNPLKESFNADGKRLYPNHQNLYSKRYSMFSDIAVQCVYNYWDKIGLFISLFFPGQMNPKRIYFSKVLSLIPKEFSGNQNFLWLKAFQENEYKELNEIRIQTVHYEGTDTKYKYQHLEKGIADEKEMQKIQSAREEIPGFYKNHIKLSLDGFEKTLLLMEEISNSLYPETT